MTQEELKTLRIRNEERQRVKSRTTPGPWYLRILDDNQAMNLIAVATALDTEPQMRWPVYDASLIIAATIVQSPHYVDVCDGRWEANAEFISFVRGDDVEADVESLIAEVERLQNKLTNGL